MHPETDPDLQSLLREFERITGCGVLVNASGDVRGEPIVCPGDAYHCFMRTEIDALVLKNCVVCTTSHHVLSRLHTT